MAELGDENMEIIVCPNDSMFYKDKNKGDLEVGNPRFLLYIKNKTYSCTTIDFPQRHHLVKKSQTPDYQQVLILLHIYDILKGTISV